MILLLLLLEVLELNSHLKVSLLELSILNLHFGKFLIYLAILLFYFFKLVCPLFQLNIQFLIDLLNLLNLPLDSQAILL
jgi:hypothetical protein